MKLIALAAAGLIIVASNTPVAAGADDDCAGSSDDGGAVISCDEVESGGDRQPGSGDLRRYLSVWLPACPGVVPTDPQAVEMACSVMLSCPDPGQIRLTLWERQVADQTGRPVQGTWSTVLSECRDPADAGELRRSLTWQDVETAIRRVGVPAADVTAPGYTLVNLDTTFYTDPHPYTRTLQIIGYTVDVDLTPTTYTWHWGDGQTTTTDTPGHPYPATDVTHAYLRHTQPRHPLALSVDVGWHARYRVDGGAWTDIPDTITIAGPATPLPVRQASAVLVEETHP